MTNTFFISDTHFGHRNTWALFKREDGTPLRPFKSTREMDDTLIKNWNKTVSPKDRVYHLGDFCIKRKMLHVLHQLNGRIHIVLGNHDPWKKSDWDQFENVTHLGGCMTFPGLGWLCTHIPVHERQLQGRWKYNLHGHLHYRTMNDSRYFNCSVECIDYTPIEIEEVKKILSDDKVPYNRRRN